MTDSEWLMHMHDQTTTAWLSTTASQIFFMQLGFLCYEVGFVKPVWTQSVILKNIEDTFVGVLTFLALGYTLSESESFHGIIGIPRNPMLIGVPDEQHDQILIAAFFASTCATVISGAVLERMKNKAYITWCLLTILVNYSFVSHWVWHESGWLSKLGFVDGAGSVVVHSTAGMSGLIAIWKLGPRRDSLDADGNLLPIEHAARPIINAIGAFFLWYGWFAFNVSSPIAFVKGIGDAIGTTALITVISPIASSCAAFVWVHFGYVELSFESLLSCMLCGLVSITGACHTCNVWEATVIGALSSVLYFCSAHVIRQKLKLDDPLQIVAIHLCCGVYSGIAEGVVANNVYGTPGIMHSGTFGHFGIQLLGVVVIVLFNFVVSYALWEVILVRVIFGKIDIRVSILDIYLGTRLFDHNYDMALDEVLNCSSNMAKQMLWEFHTYIADRYASEQLEFLIAVKVYNHYIQRNENIDKTDKYAAAKYILRIIHSYVDENGVKCINVSGSQRSMLMRMKYELLRQIKTHQMERDKKEKDKETGNKPVLCRGSTGLELDITRENVFKSVYKSVWKLVIPHFTHFLQNAYSIEKKAKFDIKMPFKLEKNWIIEWDAALQRQQESMLLADAVPQYNSSGTMLSQMLMEYDQMQNGQDAATKRKSRGSRSSGLHQIELRPVTEGEDKDATDDGTQDKKALVSIIIQ
eukprot:76041_1